MDEIKSQIDKSVNFVETEDVGFFESRYVRRKSDYFACYLSSQTGCNRGCQFCHLTATKQFGNKDASKEDLVRQARHVFEHYAKCEQAKIVHFNFMARGEPLANVNMLRNADDMLLSLGIIAVQHDLLPKFNISTIMPKTMSQSLTDTFKIITPTIYYSLYSCKSEFRKKWMPGAMDVDQAMLLLAEYQKVTKKFIKIHYAFIKGENDSYDDVYQIKDIIRKYGLIVEFNVVRYNPFSPEQGEESPNVDYLVDVLNDFAKVKVIQRVGFDVKASCGMFVSSDEKIWKS